MMITHSGSAEPIEGGRLLVAGLRDSCVLVPCLLRVCRDSCIDNAVVRLKKPCQNVTAVVVSSLVA